MMIFNVKCVKVSFFLCFVCSVVSYPKPEVDDADITEPNGSKTQTDHSSTGDSEQDTKSKDNDKYLHEDGIAGSIELNDENIEGHLQLNDNIMNQQDTKIEPSNKDQTTGLPDDNINKQIAGVKNRGVITGKIVIKDDYIEGEINLPSEFSGNDDDFNLQDDGTNHVHFIAPKFDIDLTESDERQNIDADTMPGKIKMDDDGNIEGTINLPDNGENGQPDAENGNEGQSVGDEAIAGSIEIKDDGDIEGTINVPDDSGNGQPDAGKDNEGQSVGDEAIAGSIEIKDDGDIEGTINVPDDGGNGQPDAGKDNEGQSVGDEAIAGSIEIKDDGNIEGTIDVPDDGASGQPNAGKNNEGDESSLTGSIEMNADGIIGTINLPDGLENVDHKQAAPNTGNGDITGEVEIDDQGNIDGYIGIGGGGKSKAKENQSKDEKNCWLNLNSEPYLDAMDEIDAKYSKARRQYQDDIGPDFDKKMMEVLLSSQGKAPRAIHQAHGNPNVIPAGLSLGGFGMMRMPGSMLFFHRMKLRNSTVFRVDFLQANLMDMTLVARLSLNDLHLRGSYERATTEEDMAILYLIPTYGELDVLIKSVNYKMEGRLRMLNNRLMIELVNSDILAREILLSYANSSALAKDIAFDSIEDFVGRMKCDLDLWLKDYFNDYLMYFGIVGGGKNSEIQLYEKQKTIKANEYADHALLGIKKKLRHLKAANVKLPSFTFKSVKNHKIVLKNGVLRGLDSMYRRSVATTKKNKSIRTLDIMMGFSNLKVEYHYEASIIRGMPPLAGMLILSADELVAHLEITQVDDSQTVDMNVDSIVQLKPESLTVEGPANRLIADFKYILENPIIAIMTNVMKHNIKMLKTLTRCEPRLWGEDKEYYPYNIKNDDRYKTLDKKKSKIDPVYNKDNEKKI